MDTQTVLLLILVVVAISALLISMYMPMGKSEKKEHESEDDFDLEKEHEQLRILVIGLIKKLESMAISDRDLKNQITALQSLAGVNREQIKYLTSNANKSTST